MNGRLLFWTDDNGEHWSDITPNEGGLIVSVFFLDERRGWVLLSSHVGNDRLRLELATTENSGHTWSFAPVPLPEQYPAELSGAAWLDFADTEHGWIVLGEATSSAFSIGRLLATTDRGHTWHELPRMPLAEPVNFLNATDGWLVGNSGSGGFYHTGDGGRTWEGVELSDPSYSTTSTRASYDELRFTDARNGSIAVVFSPITDAVKGSNLVLFTTSDAGRTWKPNRAIKNLRNMYGEAPVPSAFIDSILVTTPDGALVTLEPNGSPKIKQVRGVPRELRVKEVSFVSPMVGWLRMSDDRILSTTDGGEKFRWLDPGSAPHALPESFQELPKLRTRQIQEPAR